MRKFLLALTLWPILANAGMTSGQGLPLLQQDLIGISYPTKQRGHIFGRAFNVNNSRVDLWEGPTPTYVFPAAPQQMLVSSTSANDSATGTGARRVRIQYLDSNYTQQYEAIILNGTTPVPTVATNILRINMMFVTSAGSNEAAVGAVSLTGMSGTTTYGYISAGFNTARQAVYTVPRSKTGYVTHWQSGSGSTASHFCQVDLRATSKEGILTPGVFLVQDSMPSQNSGNIVSFPIPIPIPETADVKLSAVCDTVNAAAVVVGGVTGWIE